MALTQAHAFDRKLKSGEYRLYSRKVDPSKAVDATSALSTRVAAEKHERGIQFFKRRVNRSLVPKA